VSSCFVYLIDHFLRCSQHQVFGNFGWSWTPLKPSLQVLHGLFSKQSQLLVVNYKSHAAVCQSSKMKASKTDQPLFQKGFDLKVSICYSSFELIRISYRFQISHWLTWALARYFKWLIFLIRRSSKRHSKLDLSFSCFKRASLLISYSYTDLLSDLRCWQSVTCGSTQEINYAHWFTIDYENPWSCLLRL